MMQKLPDRYTSNKVPAPTQVQSDAQQPKEDARDYSTRMITATKGMLPLKKLVTTTNSFVIPNPMFDDEMKKHKVFYDLELSQLTG